MKSPRFSTMCKLGLGTMLAAVATPAFAQEAPEELVVVGTYERVPDNVESLSQLVSYADLDLGTSAGRSELRQRVRLTARYLCDRLGEPLYSSPPAASCKDAATRDALRRVGTLEEKAAPRGTAWVAGPAWEPPYPADWSDR